MSVGLDFISAKAQHFAASGKSNSRKRCPPPTQQSLLALVHLC